jgi:hypothetical protein
MKYIIGSLIISFGILLVIVIVSMSLLIKGPENILTYLGLAWIVLAILTYPLARKIVRE